MTLVTTSTKAVGTGNSANTNWPYTFLIPDLAAVTVTLVDVASGNETVVNPINFTITGLGNPVGGAVTYPLIGSPLTSATKLVVERFVDDVQQTDLTNQGGAYPEDIEDALDYLTMITQQQQDQIDRSLVFSVADSVAPNLPTASARANLFLGFNSVGDPIAVAGLTAGTTVSAAMIPVVTAPTTAAALTALGLPGALLDLLIPSGVEWPYDAGGTAPTGFVFPIGQACTPLYPDYRAKLIAAGSPYGTNGVDPLMPDRRSSVAAGKSNMGGVDNGLLTGGTVLGAVLGTQSAPIALNQVPTITSDNLATIALSVISTPSDIVRNAAGTTSSGAGGGTNGQLIGLGGSISAVGSTGNIPIGAADVTSNNTGGVSPTTLSKVQPTFICNIILKVH